MACSGLTRRGDHALDAADTQRGSITDYQPVTALEAYFLFDEQLSAVALFGGALAVTGVSLVMIRTQTS